MLQLYYYFVYSQRSNFLALSQLPYTAKKSPKKYKSTCIMILIFPFFFLLYDILAYIVTNFSLREGRTLSHGSDIQSCSSVSSTNFYLLWICTYTKANLIIELLKDILLM